MKHLSLCSLCWLLFTPPLAADEPVDYLRDIKPIFAKHCVGCHGPQKQRSGLRLDTAAGAIKGGDTGPGVVRGKGRQSGLLKALHGEDNYTKMPPGKARPSAQEVRLIERWIDEGAKAPANEVAVAAQPGHWAFQPIQRPALPAVQAKAWVRNPVDRFILTRLEKAKITPAPAADRVTLLRRLSLDLTGLPPTPAEVAAFVKDTRPDAYERQVDRLLASPHYGERWGRHWLDLAHYADSNGFNIDAPRTIWPYRDWVITALNRDLPFDQFVIKQLAGDLLPNATTADRIATGFHRNTLLNQEGGIDHEQFRIESVVDRVNTTGVVFLGLTLGCAQCHNHKFDPISQLEYYQFFAFLNNQDEPTLSLPTAAETKQLKQIRTQIAGLQQSVKALDLATPGRQKAWEVALTPAQRTQLPRAIKDILDTPDYQRDAGQKKRLADAFRRADQARQVTGTAGAALAPLSLTGPQHLAVQLHPVVLRTGIEQRVAQLKKQEPKIATTLVLQERKTPRTTHVHIQGDFLRKGKPVRPATPAVLHPLPAKAANRLDLAKWLVDPANPLTARVTVNRVWMHHFGLGIVETENDFGTQGTPPTHPELLDWLAVEFRERGWSLKALHRLIVTSATYRQSSKTRPELATVDPRNKLLARQNRLRLEAEVVRDAALAASGLLSPKIGGPSVFPPQPDGVFRFTQVQRDWTPSAGPDRYRRGIYTHFWRSAPHPALTVFDAPESTATCTRRNRSNTPLQALTLLNDLAFYEFAQGLAARVLREAPADDAARLRHAFRLCLAREPRPIEQQRLTALLTQLLAAPEPMDAQARRFAVWTTLARVLLNLDEFITRE